MPTTRRVLRQRIGGNLGERIDLTASDVGGSTSSFTDAVGLQIPDNELNGREAWYAGPSSSANYQTRRIVIANNEDTASITVAPSWPAVPQVGDAIELYNARGYSVTVPEIHDKINELIDEVSEEGAITEASTPVTFSALSPRITIPSTWYWLFGAEYSDIWGNWYPIFPGDLVVREWDSTVTIKNTKATGMAQNRDVRLIGSPRLSQLTNDTDITTVDAAWLVDQATAELRRAIAQRWGDAATVLAIGNIDLAEAEKRRPRAGGTFPNTGRRWKVGS
jgi:hypothetical protein